MGEKPGFDGFGDRLWVILGLVFAEAEKRNAQGFEFGLAIGISFLGGEAIVATAVDFDGEHPVLAIEVNDKLVDGALAQKADTKDLFFAEVLPEDYFAFGHSFAELAGASDEMFVVGQNFTAHGKDGFSFNLMFYFFCFSKTPANYPLLGGVRGGSSTNCETYIQITHSFSLEVEPLSA